VADAANDAAFEVAVDAIRDFSAFDDIAGFTVSEQDTLVTSLIQQHVLFRCLRFVIYFTLQCYVSVCFCGPLCFITGKQTVI